MWLNRDRSIKKEEKKRGENLTPILLSRFQAFGFQVSVTIQQKNQNEKKINRKIQRQWNYLMHAPEGPRPFIIYKIYLYL